MWGKELSEDSFFDSKETDHLKRSFTEIAVIALLLSLIYAVVFAVFILTIRHFILAAAGVVSPQDVVPFIFFI